MIDKLVYQDQIEYLIQYARDDWLSIGIIVPRADQVSVGKLSDHEIVDVLLLISSDLIDSGAFPGDLVVDDRNFVPWEGNKEELLQRIERELRAKIEMDGLPYPGELFWFHTPRNKVNS